MKAVVLKEYGGPEVLALEDVPKPTAARDEVLIKIHNTAVNAFEPKIRQGLGADFGLSLPFILGSEFAGTVEDVGTDVRVIQSGDAVFGAVEFQRSGAYAEYITAKANEIALKPSRASFIEAAAIPVGALTSWESLFDTAHLQSGQTVLIHAAAGDIGSLAVQLAKAKGAFVIGTASGRNEAFVKSLGADQFVDYTATHFEDVVREADVVFDTVGGATQEKSFQTLKKGGFLVSILTPPSQELAAKLGVQVAVLHNQPQSDTLAQIAQIVEAGHLKAHVETVLPLSEIRRAHELMESGHSRGKIVLQIA